METIIASYQTDDNTTRACEVLSFVPGCNCKKEPKPDTAFIREIESGRFLRIDISKLR